MENLEVNMSKEYMLAGDISVSMQTVDPRCGNMQRYDYMLEKFKLFMQTTQDFDQHGGCTVFLFGENVHKYEHADLTTVTRKLNNVRFESMTQTDELIKEAFDEHNEEKEKMEKEDKRHPGTILMIFTDGDPTNKPAVEREILKIANSLVSEDEFKIIFLTVGTIDLALRRFLDKLQDLKSRQGYRIVSVKELDQVNFVSAVI